MTHSRSHVAVGFVFQTVGLLLALTYLIFFAGSVSGYLNPALLMGLAAACLLVGTRAPVMLERPALAFVAVLVLTSLPSLDPARSFVQTWQIAAGLFLVLALIGLVGRGLSPQRMMGVLLALGGFYMLLAWLDALRWYLTWLSVYPGNWLPSISFRLNGSNVVAAFFNVLIFLAIPRAVSARRGAARLGWAFYALSGLGLLVLTSSRGGWVAALAGFAVLGLLFYRRDLWNLFQRGWERKLFRRVIFPLGCILVVGLAAAALVYYQRSAGAHPTHGSFWSSRNEFWGPALAAFLRSPWLGVGPGTFASLYFASRSVPPGGIFLHAHNQYWDILSGSGLMGLAAFVWLLWGAVSALRQRLAESSAAERPLLIGASAALGTYLAHGMFDGLYRMPFASFALICVLGAALGRPFVPAARRGGLTFWLGLLAAAYGLFNAWQMAPLHAGVQALNAGDLPLAVQQLEVGTRRNPDLAVGWQQLGLARSLQADALPAAAAAFEQAARLDPSFGAHPASLAALYRATGDLNSAARAAQEAVRLAPEEGSYWLLLGEIEAARGQGDAAQRAYRTALARQPVLAESTAFWQASPARQLAWNERPLAAAEALPEDEQAAVRQPYALPMIQLAAVYRQRGDSQAAARLLRVAQLAYFNVPSDRLELLWEQAEQAAVNGDLNAARRLGAQALAGWQQPGLHGPGSAGQSLYGPGVFRAPASRVELPPQWVPPLPDRWLERQQRLQTWQ